MTLQQAPRSRSLQTRRRGAHKYPWMRTGAQLEVQRLRKLGDAVGSGLLFGDQREFVFLGLNVVFERCLS